MEADFGDRLSPQIMEKQLLEEMEMKRKLQEEEERRKQVGLLLCLSCVAQLGGVLLTSLDCLRLLPFCDTT